MNHRYFTCSCTVDGIHSECILKDDPQGGYKMYIHEDDRWEWAFCDQKQRMVRGEAGTEGIKEITKDELVLEMI